MITYKIAAEKGQPLTSARFIGEIPSKTILFDQSLPQLNQLIADCDSAIAAKQAEKSDLIARRTALLNIVSQAVPDLNIPLPDEQFDALQAKNDEATIAALDAIIADATAKKEEIADVVTPS